MHGNEVDELRADILDAFKDLGTESTPLEEVNNIEWYSFIQSSYDDLYLEDTEKEFSSPIPMIGLCLGNTPKSELEELGLGFDFLEKLYITADQFIKNSIKLQVGDRYSHRGIKYDIIRYKKVSLASKHDVFYIVYAKETDLSAQSVEHRLEVSPTTDIDKGLEDTGTTITDSRTDHFLEYNASVVLDIGGPFDIIGGSEDSIRVHIIDGDLDSGLTKDIQLDEDLYVRSEMVIHLQNKFNVQFGDDTFLVSEIDDKINIEYQTYGENVGFELQLCSSPAYSVLGLSPGMYLSRREVANA